MCELACSLNLEKVFNPKLSRVQVEIFMDPQGEYALKCEVCEGKHCLEICPNEALEHQA